MTSRKQGKGLGIKNISGIILAGGKSSRFGVNKAVKKTNSGKLLIEFVIEALSEFCNEIVIAGLNSPFLCSFNVIRIVSDEPGLEGPIAGAIPALRLAKNDICAIVGCDMPFINPRLFKKLVSELNKSDALICVPEKNGLMEPLHAVYSRRTLPMFISFAEGGGSSLTGFIKRLHESTGVFYRYMPEKRENGISDPFFNINTEKEFEFFENYCQNGV